MSWPSKAILALVELIIYVAITPVTIYSFHKHRLPSLLSHVYLYVFIALRATADGLTISNRNEPQGSDTTGAIINSIGLSPLLLATAGLVTESRCYLLSNARGQGSRRREWLIDFTLHAIVVTGVALLAIGSSNLASAHTTTDADRYRSLAYAGTILLLVAWLAVCVLGAWTWICSHKQSKEVHQGLARLLLTEILVSLPFTGIRVCYSMVYTFHPTYDLSPATSSFVVEFFLIFLSQLIAAGILVLALIVTRNIQRAGRDQAQSALEVEEARVESILRN